MKHTNYLSDNIDVLYETSSAIVFRSAEFLYSIIQNPFGKRTVDFRQGVTSDNMAELIVAADIMTTSFTVLRVMPDCSEMLYSGDGVAVYINEDGKLIYTDTVSLLEEYEDTPGNRESVISTAKNSAYRKAK